MIRGNPKNTHEAVKRACRLILSLSPTLLIFAAVGGNADAITDEVFDCLIEPKMTVLIGAPSQGVLESVDVSRSEAVSEGQIVARLRSNVQQAALDQARVRARMKSEIQARQADLNLAEINMKRIEELFNKGMIPRQKRDETLAELEVARMGVRQAKDNRTLNEHEFAQANTLVEQRIVRSPINGVVVEQRAYPGEFVYENPIVAIAQIDPLRVEAVLPARYYRQVKPGLAVQIKPELDDGDDLHGRIANVDPVIDAASGTFSVHLDIPNSDGAIPGGQRCSLTVNATAITDAVASNR